METTKLTAAFETELNLTEQGFSELTEQKKGLVIDVSTEAGFKLARKERSEQNGTLKDIDRLAVDGKTAIDSVRNTLKERVIGIYAPIVTAFEAENIKRKEAEAKKKEKEAERIKAIRDQINGIRLWANNLTGKASSEIQDIIEAVYMIDVSENFAELTQEALTVKKETLGELTLALSSTIQNEQLATEREALRIEREEAATLARISELKSKAQNRLNNLMMIPSTMFGKTAKEIKNKVDAIINIDIDPDEFGELTEQASAAHATVVQQLNVMLAQAETMERITEKETRKAQIIENDRLLKEKEAIAEHEEELQAQRPDMCDREFANTAPLEPLPLPTQKPVNEPSLRDISIFLQTLPSPTISDFGYLLLSGDEQHEQEALMKIKIAFDVFYATKAA